MATKTRKAERFINRELSWLEFNQRVLDEAMAPTVPLLERLKFLAITASNLDEFFMVRVGGLQMLAKTGRTRREPSGLTPARQLALVSERARRMVETQYACYGEELEPRLDDANIRRVRAEDLNPAQYEHVERVFEETIYPVVTPIAVHTPAECPLLVNLCLHAVARLLPVEGRHHRFAFIPLGLGLDRFIPLPADEGYRYMLIGDVIALFADRLFPGERVRECIPFRATRNADMSVREDMASDLLSGMEDVLAARRTSDFVRLEIGEGASRTTLSFLKRALKVQDRDVYSVPGPIELSTYMKISALEGFDRYRYESWTPRQSPDADPTVDMFTTLRRQNLLLVHPYESFDPVVRLVEEAADDPDVLAIKQILYRTSRNSPITTALMRAAEKGKYVTAVVELKARFDEARNIEWARALDESGVQVIYGVKGLKTHAKVCIVVRRERDGLRRYVHFGTGNYNESTARLYGDVSYMTCDDELGADASKFFNTITGYSQPQRFGKIDMAPTGLRIHLLERIEEEIERRRQGQKASIMAKVNSLADPELIEALYAASAAGVKVQLNVRGICCLKPGVPGLSENIRVVSIIDRFLEHARIVCFHHGGDPRVYISSADWMPRNLDRRVELLTPVDDINARARLIRVLQTHFKDTAKGRELLADGGYRPPKGGRKKIGSQEALYREAVDALRLAEHGRRTMFEPHRPPKAT